MTGRGRPDRGKREPARPAQSSHCSENEEKPRPSDANAKRNSGRSSRKSTGANGDAHTATTMKKSSASAGAVKSVSCESIPPKFNGDVKPKQKREPAQTASNAASKETTDSKKTDLIARGKLGSSLQAKNDASADKVLQTTLDKLKIKKAAKADSSCIINDIVDTIIRHLKQKSEHFRDVHKMSTGSYYENVKISKPDEFDVMLAVRVERVALQQYDEEGAFYSVALKRPPKDHPLRNFLHEDNTIAASKMLVAFRDHVKEAVKSISGVAVERKKPGCPAVTLLIEQDGSEIGLDVVLSLEVQGHWPEFTKDGFNIDSWLGTKVKKMYKFCPFYLVPKYGGKGTDERNGVSAKDVWRISFSHVEKDILKNHGQAKTCCEAEGVRCCRKPCLKLLKHLLHQLKQKHPRQLSKFFSYLCKTTLLHACSLRGQDSDWRMEHLADCFQQLLEDFVGHLRNGLVPNFFIPTHNLLGSAIDRKSLDFLADCIETERNNGFPIFQE